MSPDPHSLAPLLQQSIVLSEKITGLLLQDKLLDDNLNSLMAEREKTIQELASVTENLIDYDANVGAYNKKMRHLLEADKELRQALERKRNLLDEAQETQVHEQKADKLYRTDRRTSVFIQGKLEA